MAPVFPPIPVYPNAIDSDRTLFLVYNTTETHLAENNAAFAEEIHIIPVKPHEDEIWPDNGFANMEGELMYYDTVEKNAFGKVNKLKRVARNLGGKKSKYNTRFTCIRSYVVAEHHNQFVTALLKTEDFIGYNFDPRFETLDWRIRNLQGLQPIFDDYNCPDVTFTFNIIGSDNEAGILTEYLIELDGPINNFLLDFGDGTVTSTELQGQHRYALNAIIDPVVTVSNDQCEVVQTPVERLNPQEPPIVENIPFDIPIPEFQPPPDFEVVPCDIPDAQFAFPPIVFPCISVALDTTLPSILAEIPTFISLTEIPSQIELIGCDLPPFIEVIVPDISVTSDIPETIVVEGFPSSIAVDLGLNLDNIPALQVDWGTQPEIEVRLAMAKDVRITKQSTLDPALAEEFGPEFADMFDDKVKVEYENVGIPSEINVIPPEIEDIKVDASELKSVKIKVESPNIPSDIKIFGPDSPIPTSISIFGPNTPIPDIIKVFNEDVPNRIEAVNVGIPYEIIVKSDIPDYISLDSGDLPQKMEDLAAALRAIPDSFELKLPPELESGLRLLPPKPEEMPPIELVYKGAPVELKINLVNNVPQPENADAPCVMLIPCQSK